MGPAGGATLVWAGSSTHAKNLRVESAQTHSRGYGVMEEC